MLVPASQGRSIRRQEACCREGTQDGVCCVPGALQHAGKPAAACHAVPVGTRTHLGRCRQRSPHLGNTRSSRSRTRQRDLSACVLTPLPLWGQESRTPATIPILRPSRYRPAMRMSNAMLPRLCCSVSAAPNSPCPGTAACRAEPLFVSWMEKEGDTETLNARTWAPSIP